MEYRSFEKLKKDGKPYRYRCYRLAKARLRKSLNRYNCGATVGHGWYSHLSHTDPSGSEITIYGAFSDGRLSVNLRYAGCAVLSLADIEVYDTSELTEEERKFLSTLPTIPSRISENGNLINDDGKELK